MCHNVGRDGYEVQNLRIATDQVDAGVVPDANASYAFYER